MAALDLEKEDGTFETASFQSPCDIDIAFSRINRACRAAFFDHVSKDFTSINLRFYRGPLDQITDFEIQQTLDVAFAANSTRSLFAGILNSKTEIPTSIMRMDMEEFDDCGGCPVADVVFLATQANIIWLSEIIHMYSEQFKHLGMYCADVSKQAGLRNDQILIDLCAIARGMNEVSIWSATEFHDRSLLEEFGNFIVKTPFESDDKMALIVEYKLNMMSEKGDKYPCGRPGLHLLSMMVANHILFIQDNDNSNDCRATALLYEPLQRGLALHLLSAANKPKSQAHFLLGKQETCSWTLTWECLVMSESFRCDFEESEGQLNWVIDWQWFADGFRLLMSAVTLELAIARATLLDDLLLDHLPMSCGNPLPPNHPITRSYTWYSRAYETLSVLNLFADNDAFVKQTPHNLQMMNFFAWRREINLLHALIRHADQYRTMSMWRYLPQSQLNDIGTC